MGETCSVCFTAAGSLPVGALGVLKTIPSMGSSTCGKGIELILSRLGGRGDWSVFTGPHLGGEWRSLEIGDANQHIRTGSCSRSQLRCCSSTRHCKRASPRHPIPVLYSTSIPLCVAGSGPRLCDDVGDRASARTPYVTRHTWVRVDRATVAPSGRVGCQFSVLVPVISVSDDPVDDGVKRPDLLLDCRCSPRPAGLGVTF